MINETTLAFSNTTSLPITVTTSISQGQFTISVILSILSMAFILYWIYGNTSFRIKERIVENKLKKKTGRPTLFINHRMGSGMFGNVEMIDEKTLLKITRFLSKHKEQEVNLVLHTPGGIVFHTQAIAHQLHTRSKKVHAYVPVYAMSGGTLLSLASHRLYIGKTAAIGPVDPQLGHFWAGYSTESHNKVVAAKGNKSEDTSIAFANEGNKCLVEIEADVKLFLQDKLRPSDVAAWTKKFTDGRYTHGKRFVYNDLKNDFRNIDVISDEDYDLLVKAL